MKGGKARASLPRLTRARRLHRPNGSAGSCLPGASGVPLLRRSQDSRCCIQRPVRCASAAAWVSRSPRCRHRRGRTAPTGFPATLEPQRTTLSIGTERGSRRSSSRRCQWPTRLFLPEINASRRSISVSIAEDAKCITANTENSAVKNACKININFAPALV